ELLKVINASIGLMKVPKYLNLPIAYRFHKVRENIINQVLNDQEVIFTTIGKFLSSILKYKDVGCSISGSTRNRTWI
ncbi:MAG: hypothetical protein QNL86_03555, partial [Crocinitomicaceae bacterium]